MQALDWTKETKRVSHTSLAVEKREETAAKSAAPTDQPTGHAYPGDVLRVDLVKCVMSVHGTGILRPTPKRLYQNQRQEGPESLARSNLSLLSSPPN